MASASPGGPKRKRGRPAGASRVTADASKKGPGRTKKRGAEDPVADDSEITKRPSKRTRRTENPDESSMSNVPQRVAGLRRSGRDRNSGSQVDQSSRSEAHGSPSPQQQEQPGKRRGRPPAGASKLQAQSAQNHDDNGSDARPAKKKKGRGQAAQQDPATDNDTEVTSKARGRGRPATSKATATASEQVTESQQAKGPKKARGPAKQAREANAEESQGQDPSVDEDEEQGPEFRGFVPQERRVPMSTVNAKYVRLDPEAMRSLVENKLSNAHAQALHGVKDTNHRRQVGDEALLQMNYDIAKALRNKKLRFPPALLPNRSIGNRLRSGHEEEFDLERILDLTRSLENQLGPLRDSIALLKREKEKEEMAVEKDYANLRALEHDAQQEARDRKKWQKGNHVLAPDPSEASLMKHQGGIEFLDLKDSLQGDVFETSDDAELTALTTQITSHMDSLQRNLQPLEGLDPTISHTKARLQSVIKKHRPDELERLMLG